MAYEFIAYEELSAYIAAKFSFLKPVIQMTLRTRVIPAGHVLVHLLYYPLLRHGFDFRRFPVLFAAQTENL